MIDAAKYEDWLFLFVENLGTSDTQNTEVCALCVVYCVLYVVIVNCRTVDNQQK